jgi:hypothetical protein
LAGLDQPLGDGPELDVVVLGVAASISLRNIDD